MTPYNTCGSVIDGLWFLSKLLKIIYVFVLTIIFN